MPFCESRVEPEKLSGKEFTPVGNSILFCVAVSSDKDKRREMSTLGDRESQPTQSHVCALVFDLVHHKVKVKLRIKLFLRYSKASYNFLILNPA